MAQKPEQMQRQQEPKNPQESPNTETSEGKLPPNQIGDLRSQEGRGRWGKLPKRDVEEMYDNGRLKLPSKYQMLLEEYFGRLPKPKSQ